MPLSDWVITVMNTFIQIRSPADNFPERNQTAPARTECPSTTSQRNRTSPARIERRSESDAEFDSKDLAGGEHQTALARTESLSTSSPRSEFDAAFDAKDFAGDEHKTAPSCTESPSTSSPRSESDAEFDAKDFAGDEHKTAPARTESPSTSSSRSESDAEFDEKDFAGDEFKLKCKSLFLELSDKSLCELQLTLFSGERRKPESFRQANGRGRLELKLGGRPPAGPGPLSLEVRLGGEVWRAKHDFSLQTPCFQLRSLDFAALVDRESGKLKLQVRAA